MQSLFHALTLGTAAATAALLTDTLMGFYHHGNGVNLLLLLKPFELCVTNACKKEIRKKLR